MPLPELREELALLPGPRLADGQPSWTLHDPVRNRFFSIDWPTCEILQRWSYNDPDDIADSIRAATTLDPSPDEVLQVAEFLKNNQLVKPEPGAAPKMAAMLRKQKGGRLEWLLHHYLFFRIPLWRPDAVLRQSLPLVQPLFSRGFFLLTLLVLVLGLSQVFRQWDFFMASLVDTFSLSGLLSYGIALTLVKLLHELGHAFTARRHGCRVPTMGVAFLVMWPMAYTDTNEAWKLTSRWQRLQVSVAGILTELIIAAWCTLAWALLPDGGLRDSAFILATTSWIGTLAINASPFMRFDGYFIVSDWLDMPNLHERAIALARWRLREWLFDLREPCPEHFAPRKEKALIVFALCTMLYRLVLFLGIAVLVYHFFIKLVGILLFLVEIIWFVAMPILSELRAWRERWPLIRRTRRSRITLLVAVVLLGLFCVPWPGRLHASAVLRPTEVWPLFAQGPARVASLPRHEWQRVTVGEQLLDLYSPKLESERRGLQARVQTLRWEAASAGMDAESRAVLQSRREELATALSDLARVENELKLYRTMAPFDGVVRDVVPDLQAGQWLSNKERIALLVGRNLLVETYLDEEQVKRIAVGDTAAFMADSGTGPLLHLRVTNIDADASRTLADGLLTAEAGGHILSRRQDQQRVPEHAMYRVSLAVESPLEELEGQSWRGQVVIHAQWEAPASRYLRNLLAILVREASF